MKQKIWLILLLLFSAFPVFAQLESIEYHGEVDYYFGTGLQLPLFGSLYPGRGSEDILLGLQSNRIIDSLYITALADERFSALLDYDSERNDFLGSGNEYQLLYTGPEYNFVKKISLGNIEPLFPQNNIFPHYPGSNNGLSMFFAGNNRLFSIDALVRYDNTARMQKAFSGSSEIIESSQSDKSYVKRKYYFLPDSEIDAAELKLFQKKSEGDENLITSYSRLYPEKDYSFDSNKGWILLKSQLPSNTGLVVRYLINGNSAGDASLGINAIINSDGERKNFNKSTYPEYFRFIDEEEYLILQEEQLDSFWELKNAYYLPGSSGTSAEIKKAELINNISGEENSSYQSILYNNYFYSDDGVFFFIAEDETGFHPRPFPGNAPFINSTTGDNPYSIQNPVYSGISGNGIHSLNVTVFSPVSSYFLSYGIIENSIEVVIGGRPVAGNLYSVDYDTGTISFTAGVLSASSLVVVSWNEGGETGTDEKLSGALSIGIDKGVQFGFHTKFELPVADRYQLTIEDQADSFLDLGLSADYLIGSKENSYIEFNAAAGLRYPVPGITDARTISSFKGEYNYSVSVSEDNWQIAGTSSLLESLMPAVNLNTRGELLYTSYYEDTVVKGTILHSIYWDAPADQHYAYSMQSGPYNTSDAFDGGNSRSLVLEYSFADGSDSPYINSVVPLKNIDLDFSDQLSITYKTLETFGELPKLYIELLSTYQEDIDGDDLLDSELSTEEAGFMIVPTDGTQTFIGKSCDGGSNSKKDSEDLNRNGVLDPAGPFLTDTEEGLVLAQSGENYSLAVDSELDWTTSVIDLAGFVASDNAVFQNATAIRLTIGIPDTNIAGDSSGKIVINEINFEGVPFDNLSPALAKIQFIVPSVLGVPSLSGSFPDMTEDDKAMLWELSNDIAAGNTASVRYSPVINQELRYYKNIVFYVYTPSSSNFPYDTGLEIRFELQNGGIVKYTLPMESFQNGWNEITIPVHSGNSLLINGQQENGIISEPISSPVSSYMFSLKSDSADIPADNYLLLNELVTDGYSGRFSSIGSAGITFSLAEGLIPVQGGRVISKLSGALQGEVDAAITDEIQIKNYSTAGNIDGNIIDCFPFKFSGYYSVGSPDFEADQNIVSDISAMLGFSHENLDWLPELAVSYHAGNSYTAAAGNQVFFSSLEEIIHDELESVSYSYSFAQRSEKTENQSGAVPYLEHKGSAELYFPYVVFEGNVKVTQQFDDVDIFSIVPLSYLGSFINGKFINYQNNQTVNNQVDEYISISLTPEFLMNFNASQSFKWSNLLYPDENASGSMNHSIELQMPFTFGNIVIIPGISRADTKKTGIAVDFNTSLSSHFGNLFSILGGEDISAWLRAPLEQLKKDPLYSDFTNAVLSETLSLDFSQKNSPEYLPDSIETYFHREASITSSIESIEMNIGGKIKKRVFKELENNSTLNTNGSLFLDVTDNWLYQERAWKVGIAWFLLYLRPESQWTADMSIQYRRNNLNTELPDLNTMYVIDDSTSMLWSASISLFRPVEYRDNKLFDTFTKARHTESLKLELGFFPQELIPVQGTSRILFQTGFTNTSEFFIYENFSLEASLFLQGGREEFWVSGEPEYRDSAGVELRLAGHQYF